MKLHLGCGSKELKGYIHVDLANYPHIKFQKPIFPLDFVQDGCVDEIYTSHALEYYSFSECFSVLSNWFLKLSKDGSLRLSVPDFDKLLIVYAQENQNIDKIIGPMYGRWENPDGSVLYHRTVFNRLKLISILRSVGFSDISDWDPLGYFGRDPSSYDDYSKAFYPHMDFENGFPISLNLICKK